MPTVLDLALVVLIAVVWVAYEHYVAWPRFVRRVARGGPRARIGGYQQILAAEWGLSAVALVAWAAQRHPWAVLWIAPPAGARLWIALALCALVAVLMGIQLAGLRRRPISPRLQARVAKLSTIVPQAPAELGWFLALSLTAGVCEEWLFRGIVTAVLASALGLPIAVLLCNVSFGLGHAYQGGAGILKTGAVGLVMSAIVMLTGSLLPVMFLHAIVDIGSGLSAYWIVSRPPSEPASAPAA